MGFLLPCPNCGQRDIYEFKFGGEQKDGPDPSASLRDWRHYIHFNKNLAGEQEEWWYHFACDEWLLVRRDTTSNRIISVRRMEEAGGEV
jgi:sarcosine oxidase subunit delta